MLPKIDCKRATLFKIGKLKYEPALYIKSSIFMNEFEIGLISNQYQAYIQLCRSNLSDPITSI